LGEVEPIPLAASLYLCSGIGLLGIKAYQRSTRWASDREGKDWEQAVFHWEWHFFGNKILSL